MSNVYSFGVYLNISADSHEEAVNKFQEILDDNEYRIVSSYNFEIAEIA